MATHHQSPRDTAPENASPSPGGTLLQIRLHNPENLAQRDLVLKELQWLSIGNNLQQRMEEMSSRNGSFDRVFVLGCGRSGTWLLMQLLSTLADQDIVPKELPVQAFGIFATRTSRLLIKRHFDSHHWGHRLIRQGLRKDCFGPLPRYQAAGRFQPG
jgi:hypothetical protein